MPIFLCSASHPYCIRREQAGGVRNAQGAAVDSFANGPALFQSASDREMPLLTGANGGCCFDGSHVAAAFNQHQLPQLCQIPSRATSIAGVSTRWMAPRSS